MERKFIDLDQIINTTKSMLPFEISSNQIKIFMLYLFRFLTGAKFYGNCVLIKDEESEWGINNNIHFDGSLSFSRGVLPRLDSGMVAIFLGKTYIIEEELAREEAVLLIENVLNKISKNYKIDTIDTDDYFYPNKKEDYDKYMSLIVSTIQSLAIQLDEDNIKYIIDFYDDDYIKSKLKNAKNTCFIVDYDSILTIKEMGKFIMWIKKIKRKDLKFINKEDTNFKLELL